MLSDAQRQKFDAVLDAVIDTLPAHITALFEEVPLIVEDEPSDALLDDMDIDRRTTDLCGLHWGIALTHRSVEQSGNLPDRMMLFRGPIVRLAGRNSRGGVDDKALRRQVRITLLHEVGHHFGLDEDDLTALGYG
ncbi:MAG: hypothetical protein GC164_11280 [Phycisphaera sp.]|nr:hypothetical protein [Phycisphaera sp.]